MVDPCVTIRYIHNPVYHIIDISRESFTSTDGSISQGKPKLILPIHAIAQRAHLIKDVEDYDGTRLLDNSWLPNSCEPAEITTFNRQLKYANVIDVYNNLTDNQKIELEMYLGTGDTIGPDGGIIEVEP